MNSESTKKTSSPKRLALTAFALCVGCCAAIPVFGILGLTALSALGVYFEMAALGLLLAGTMLFAYHYIGQRNIIGRAQSCNIDCGCKDGKRQ